MSRIRGKDTSPEMKVRSLIHRLGYRYRLHDKKLPGKPDLVFRGRRKIIFVHGCFWHGHEHCRKGQLPKSNLDYWQPKIEENKRRDEKNSNALRDAEWRILTIWQCELKNLEGLEKRVIEFLN
jgi:DNA mismatch endonuclease (patch repair protein)